LFLLAIVVGQEAGQALASSGLGQWMLPTIHHLVLTVIITVLLVFFAQVSKIENEQAFELII
jgi:hypothetical protein